MTNNPPPHTAVRTTRRPLAVLAMAALIGIGSSAVALAAAAGADPGGDGTPANPEQAAKYSECMRANGVTDFPTPNADGHLAYGGVSVPKAVWVNAVQACTDLEPPGWSTQANRTPAQQDTALRFAQCVRDNGVPDFPDPATARDPLIDTSKMRGGVSAHSIPELQPALDGCRYLLQAALADTNQSQ